MKYLSLLLLIPSFSYSMLSRGFRASAAFQVARKAPALTRTSSTLSFGQKDLLRTRLVQLQKDLQSEEKSLEALNENEKYILNGYGWEGTYTAPAILIAARKDRILKIKDRIFEAEFKLQEEPKNK